MAFLLHALREYVLFAFLGHRLQVAEPHRADTDAAESLGIVRLSVMADAVIEKMHDVSPKNGQYAAFVAEASMLMVRIYHRACDSRAEGGRQAINADRARSPDGWCHCHERQGCKSHDQPCFHVGK